MSRSAAEDSDFNIFHSLAALGQTKLALKTISTTPKKIITAGLSARDKKGRTPLHLAAYYGHLKVLKIFLEAAPQACEIRDSQGNNVRDALRRPGVSVIGDPECQQCFRRMVKIDKKDFQYEDFGLGPMDVWDLSVSANSSVAVIKPSWGGSNSRTLISSLKGVKQQFNLGEGDEPRHVAMSNIHTVVVTADRCYAWGKNVNGVLGLDIEEKLITEPRALNMSFAKASKSESMNAFSVLEGRGKSGERFKDPLIGADCCDFHSVCYTTMKIWSWGANRGQMMNKVPLESIAETPTLIYQSSVRIRSVRCCDNAIVVLLSNGQVVLLFRGKVSRLQSGGRSAQDIDSMAARGSSVVVQAKNGKLLRYSLNSLFDDKDGVQTLWTPRRREDHILSFDLGNNGNVILSTKSGVYRIEEDRAIIEFKALRGVALTSIKSDPQFKSFVGVNSISAGLGLNRTQNSDKVGYKDSFDYIEWCGNENLASSRSGNFTLRCNDETLLIHKSLLFARCPTLRPFIIGASLKDKIIAAPGGSTTFRQNGSDKNALLVEHSHLESVKSFVNALHYARDAPQPDQSAGMSVGPILHEFNALMRLCTKDLGDGMWDAKLSGISCDVRLDGLRVAHSAILASASPVLAAQLSRWSNGTLQDPALNESTVDDVLRHAYTGEITESAAQIFEHESAQKLLDLWQAADKLLMAKLCDDCEVKLFQMLNLSLVIPFLHATSSHETRLFHSLVDIVVRNMPYFVALITEFETDLLDTIERLYKKLPETESVDQQFADAFETLKDQNSPSNTLKTRRTLKFVGSELSQSKKPAVAPTSDKRSDALSRSHVQLRNAQAVMAPTESPVSVSSNEYEGGWIPSRKKSRNSSTHSPEARLEAASVVTISLDKHSLNIAPPSSDKLTLSAPHKSSPDISSSGPKSLNGNQPLINSPLCPVQMVRIGNSLPTLGSMPKSNANRKSPRPKLSLKWSKSIQQFKDPAQFAENLEHTGDTGSSIEGTPWKQSAQVVQTSQAILERLERAHQANNRKLAGGNVWKI